MGARPATFRIPSLAIRSYIRALQLCLEISSNAAALSDQTTPVSLPLRSLVEENAAMKAATVAAAVAKPAKLKRYQQSFGPLFKAYAIALKAKVMGDAGDMLSEDQAFSTSTSMQPGVPLKMHDAYINGRIFSLSDAMQTENCPTLGEGRHSFVEYLEKVGILIKSTMACLTWVLTCFEATLTMLKITDEEKLRNAEEKYRAIKREASVQFELSEFKWKEALKRDPSITLDHWIEKYGYDYLDACEERVWAKTNLKRAQQTGSQDVLRQKDLMESALNSQKLLPGSNMSCAVQYLDTTERSFGKKDLGTIRRTIADWKLELEGTAL
ncbi:hypothetical protein CSAL01_12953 [Colletotrichum salicis]|uniref:Uncharacterized protein n=1 Tax=Colletotrichum salicis TaxID=1209931 RepID=A0A135URG1_9PEZI|nr:hypothetical protein CSAL01_12953 [Colletotrichum salicis]